MAHGEGDLGHAGALPKAPGQFLWDMNHETRIMNYYGCVGHGASFTMLLGYVYEIWAHTILGNLLACNRFIYIELWTSIWRIASKLGAFVDRRFIDVQSRIGTSGARQ